MMIGSSIDEDRLEKEVERIKLVQIEMISFLLHRNHPEKSSKLIKQTNKHKSLSHCRHLRKFEKRRALLWNRRSLFLVFDSIHLD
jgi:hypothetical protein